MIEWVLTPVHGERAAVAAGDTMPLEVTANPVKHEMTLALEHSIPEVPLFACLIHASKSGAGDPAAVVQDHRVVRDSHHVGVMVTNKNVTIFIASDLGCDFADLAHDTVSKGSP